MVQPPAVREPGQLVGHRRTPAVEQGHVLTERQPGPHDHEQQRQDREPCAGVRQSIRLAVGQQRGRDQREGQRHREDRESLQANIARPGRIVLPCADGNQHECVSRTGRARRRRSARAPRYPRMRCQPPRTRPVRPRSAAMSGPGATCSTTSPRRAARAAARRRAGRRRSSRPSRNFRRCARGRTRSATTSRSRRRRSRRSAHQATDSTGTVTLALESAATARRRRTDIAADSRRPRARERTAAPRPETR